MRGEGFVDGDHQIHRADQIVIRLRQSSAFQHGGKALEQQLGETVDVDFFAHGARGGEDARAIVIDVVQEAEVYIEGRIAHYGAHALCVSVRAYRYRIIAKEIGRAHV